MQHQFNGIAILTLLIVAATWLLAPEVTAQPVILDPADYSHYVTNFNANNALPYDGTIPDSAAWSWMTANVPLFDCPEATRDSRRIIEQIDAFERSHTRRK